MLRTNPKRLRPIGLSVSLALCGLAVATPVTAQVLEEVIVTAQKREQSLQDVGISVTAYSGDQLDALGMTNTVEISQQVPGLQYQQFSPAFTILNLRGISQNNFTDNLEAPVAVYVDGAYSASMNAAGAQLFDIDRVEVLRGPQGTLFGRNTTGGLVHYITRGAREEELNGYARISFSDFSKRTVEGAVGGGLSDRVRARLAGRWEEADGYVESLNNLVRDQNGANGYAIRASMEVDFSDSLFGDFRLAYAKDDDVPAGFFTTSFYANPGLEGFDLDTGFGITDGLIRPADPWTHDSDYQGRFDRELTDFGATFTWDTDNALEVVSITNWKSLDKFYTEDSDGGQNPFVFVFEPTADVEQFSQEFRISGETDRSNWQVGAYFLDMSYDLNVSVTDPPFPGYQFLGGPIEASITDVDLDSQNWSVFGQTEIAISDEWTFIAGLRWSQDDKEIDWVVNDRFADGSIVQNPGSLSSLLPTNPGLDEIDYGDYAARLQFNWQPTDDALVFFSLNRGIKGGNWTPPVTADPTVILKHDEETLLAYEIGTKITLGNGRSRLNATVFHYDYEDYQAFSFNGALTPQVSNSDASSLGGEIEFFTSPGEGWDIVFGASFVDSEVDAIPTVFGGTVEGEFPNAPGVSLNWLARYEWSLGSGSAAIQVDGNYNDDQFLLGTNAEVSRQDAYSLWNASISYRSANDRWEGSLWMKNLTDEEYLIYSLDLALAGLVTDIYGPPQWFGATLTYHWD